jgi:ferric-dicitrate binding protein FerR (iron transport regulator)
MKTEQFDDLLGKHLTGSLSADEEREFELLTSGDPKLKLYKENAESLWQKSHGLKVLYSADKCKIQDFKKVCDRIRTKRKEVHRRLNTRWVAAAVVFVVIGSSAFWAYMNVPGWGRWQAVSSHNEITMFELPDHSVVTLNKNSRIVYLKKPAAEKREVRLKGEAFFEVQPSKSSPFVVANGDARIMVLGTSFNAKTDSKSNVIEVSVTEGSVKYSYDKSAIILQKGETGVYRDGKLQKLVANEDINDWKKSLLNFKDNSLSEVVNTLTLYFPQIVSIDDQSTPSSVKITTRFEEQSLNDIFKELALHFNKKFELKEGILTISD